MHKEVVEMQDALHKYYAGTNEVGEVLAKMCRAIRKIKNRVSEREVMSIKGLERISKVYDSESDISETSVFNENNKSILIHYFMKSVVEIFKDQSDEIADLRQELAKKEDAFSVDDVKVGGTD